MSERPRRWFQLHLITAILMMIVAGISVQFFVPFLQSKWPRLATEPWDLTGTSGEFSDSLAQNASPYTVILQEIPYGRIMRQYDLIVKDDSGAEIYRKPVESGKYTPFFIRNGVLYHPKYHMIGSGCALIAFDLKTRQLLWEKPLLGIGPIDHSKYSNRVYCKISGETIVVYGEESAGNYLEIVDMNSGATIANRGFPRPNEYSTSVLLFRLLLSFVAIGIVGFISEAIIRRKRAQP